jgi:phosphatidylglycerol:prolipoprotein diacylglycerol transferase
MNLTLNKLTPRKLSLVILSIGLILATFLAYPISLVFNGTWKLNQQIDLLFVDYINIFSTQIPIGQVSIRFYAICIILGMLCGYALAIFLSKWHFIAGTVVDRLFIGLVIFGLVGARLFYVAFNWESFASEPVNILLIFKGGLSFFGMLIATVLYVWAYSSRFKFNFFEFADFLAPSVLLGQIIGRFGNFFNYEAYGGPTKAFWKMFVPDTANIYENLNEKYFHPTFLYEIIPNFILLICLLYWYEKLTHKKSGVVFGLYCLGYGFIRYFTEFFRLDALKIKLPQNIQFEWQKISIDSIPVSQLAALILIICGLIIVWTRRRTIYLKKTMTEYAI